MKPALCKKALFALAAFAGSACARNAMDSGIVDGRPLGAPAEDRVARTSQTVSAIGGGPRDPEQRFSSSVAKIAGARCDREMRCGNVGPNEKFSTRAECVSKTEADKHNDIKTEDCMLGVSQTGLTECLKTIRDEDCDNPIDSIMRLRACRSGNVCLK